MLFVVFVLKHIKTYRAHARIFLTQQGLTMGKYARFHGIWYARYHVYNIVNYARNTVKEIRTVGPSMPGITIKF